MGLQSGYNVGASTPNQRGREIESHESAMETAETGRATSRLGQLETLQKIRDTESKYGDYTDNAGLRDEERAAKIAAAKNAGLQAQQDSEARRDVDSVSRLDMAYKSNNVAMWESTLDEMSPGTRQALEGIPADQIPEVLQQMRQVAIGNLDTLRKTHVEDRKQGAKGTQDRISSRQTHGQNLETQEIAEGGANYRARLGAGVPGMIENMKPEDPGAADQYGRDYIESAIAKNQNAGRGTAPTQDELNKSYDRSVKSGMEMTASSIVTEYRTAGVDIPDVDEDDLPKMTGWSAMRTQANKWAKMGASGADVHDGLMANYLLVDRDSGAEFISMPKNARGEIVGTKTALDLLQEARDTGEDIQDVIKRYGRRIKHTTGTSWDHGL